jgi:hypothetical protein
MRLKLMYHVTSGSLSIALELRLICLGADTCSQHSLDMEAAFCLFTLLPQSALSF